MSLVLSEDERIRVRYLAACVASHRLNSTGRLFDLANICHAFAELNLLVKMPVDVYSAMLNSVERWFLRSENLTKDRREPLHVASVLLELGLFAHLYDIDQEAKRILPEHEYWALTIGDRS